METLSTPKKLLGYFRRYWITAGSTWIRQRDGWVELRRNEIAALKFRSVSWIIIRYYNGRRLTVSLYRFPNYSYDAVCRSLRDAMRQNEEKRRLWHGAKVLRHYDLSS